MTTPLHGVTTFCLAHAMTGDILFSAAVAFIGMEPDLYALEETFWGDYADIYHEMHHPPLWRWFIAPYALHLLVDRLTHKRSGGWAWWAYPVEGIGWGISIAYLILKFWK